ncbi:hypothetical protein PWT90_03151 [Aphanocladium album]|nr:hypothetical protein PWT90_03151 [Aphanocladium album]
MKFVTLAVAASSIAAVSAEVGGVTNPPFFPPQVLVCNGPNATGECVYIKNKLGECTQLQAPFRTNSSTFAPDGDNFACFPRLTDCDTICKSPTGCTFGQVDFNYEHKFNLTAIGWNTLIRSFDCFVKKDKN